MDVIQEKTTDAPQEELSVDKINLIKNKVYSLNGFDYRLKAIKLYVQHNGAKFSAAYQKIIFFNTAGIPIEDVHEAEKRLKELEVAFTQKLEISKDESKTQDIRDAEYKEYERLKGLHETETEAFKNDSYLQQVNNLYFSAIDAAYKEVTSDELVIFPLLKSILKGNTDKLSAESEGITDFISEVMNDFLYLYNTKELL